MSRHEFSVRVAISASPRWNGSENVPSWVCEFCANGYDDADSLRAHIAEEHPGVEIASEYGTDTQQYKDALAYVESIRTGERFAP